MCVDYHALNKVTLKNKCLIPLDAKLFDRLPNARYFTKLDLRSGCWQVRIVEVMREKLHVYSLWFL